MSIVALLVSKDKTIAEVVRRAADSVRGCRLSVIADYEEALDQFQRSDVGVSICHVQTQQDLSCTQIVMRELIRGRHPLATLVINDSPHPEWELELLRAGAVDCLSRPLNIRRLGFLIDSLTLRSRYEFVMRPRASSDANMAALTPDKLDRTRGELCLVSEASQRLFEQANAIADKDCAVLLTGETGTGKTRLARYLHESSSRAQQPFVHVDCAGIPEALLESELFGHRKGSFTGAVDDQMGKCAAAKGGTLFLDEIDSLSPTAQTRLLRLADERVYEPVGTTKALPLSARVIAATNKNLEEEVAAGRFRSDLYFRLNVVQLEMPLLQSRRDDIRPLAEFFLQDVARRNRVDSISVSVDFWNVIERYDWPGNIRELKNVIERAAALCRNETISVSDLPDKVLERFRGSPGASTGESNAMRIDASHDLTAVSAETAGLSDSSIIRRYPEKSPMAVGRMRGEIRKIVEILRETGNNRSRAARELGISRESLYRKLRKYDLMNFGTDG